MIARLSFLYKAARRAASIAADALLIVATPLAEKNPAKLLALRAPLVLSMARVVVLAFAVAMLREIWRRGSASGDVHRHLVGYLKRRDALMHDCEQALVTRQDDR